MPTVQPLIAYEIHTNTCLYSLSFIPPNYYHVLTSSLPPFHRPLFFSAATSSHASYSPNDLLHIGFSLSEGVIPIDLRIHASYPPNARFRRGRKTTPEQPPPPGQLELRLPSSFGCCG
ncbi:hypothetical protein E3N88_06482 [Mikania micrantha]|uniref:Uncharacterized protein n=1 Tax=Mikania micrantha TaxID=192012 RepID=A0A5N6PQ44_9ASTR|nr:hypothetical protein E3N88_06482 [Mikania micrantha]